jgi:hypothetical protein
VLWEDSILKIIIKDEFEGRLVQNKRCALQLPKTEEKGSNDC